MMLSRHAREWQAREATAIGLGDHVGRITTNLTKSDQVYRRRHRRM